LAIALVLSWSGGGCVSHVFRAAEPACVLRTGLDAQQDDLVLVEIVHGIYPRYVAHAVVGVSQGWQTAPASPRADGLLALDAPRSLRLVSRDEESTDLRLLRFAWRDTTRWSQEDRVEQCLLLAADLPTADRRSYRIVNLRRADGRVDLELHGVDATGGMRVLGEVALPADWTPRELSGFEQVLLVPPLAVLNAAMVPVTAVSLVLLIPFGSLHYLFGDEPVDPPHWVQPRTTSPDR
jgi:hypothetical protein